MTGEKKGRTEQGGVDRGTGFFPTENRRTPGFWEIMVQVRCRTWQKPPQLLCTRSCNVVDGGWRAPGFFAFVERVLRARTKIIVLLF